MKKILYLLTVCICGCMSMFGQTDFEYRIVSNMVDSTLNGWEISLTNDSDWITEDFGVVENGTIDIKGESKRTSPATLHIRNTNPENKKNFNINLIIEPGFDKNHFYSCSQGFNQCILLIYAYFFRRTAYDILDCNRQPYLDRM